MDLGDEIMSVAMEKQSARDMVIISDTSRDLVGHFISVLDQLSTQHFVRCLQVYGGAPHCHLVFEPMTVSLAHVDGDARTPTEKEIRAKAEGLALLRWRLDEDIVLLWSQRSWNCCGTLGGMDGKHTK